MPPRNLARFLRNYLDQHGVTQRQLAAELPGVTETRVSRWVTGHDVPGPRFRDALAERLGITRAHLDRLCTRDNNARAREELETIERAVQRLRAMVDGA